MDWLVFARRGWVRLAGVVFVLLRSVLVVALVGGACGRADAQIGAQTVEEALHRMSDRAAVIFVGRVVAVRRIAGGSDGSSGMVEVEFAVEQAVRGCSPGTYVMREWAGLWASNDARYRVGQRRLMMLHGVGAGGMSSPVEGMDGAMPVYGQRGVGEMVDLRWVGTKLQRPVVYAAVAAPRVGAGKATAMIRPTDEAKAGGSTAVSASVPAQAAGVAVVVGLLQGWSPEVSVAGR
jgi:hypothetical protein